MRETKEGDRLTEERPRVREVEGCATDGNTDRTNGRCFGAKQYASERMINQSGGRVRKRGAMGVP